MENFEDLISISPPMSFDEICQEISEILGKDINEVSKRVWKESLMCGANVMEDAIKFGIDFHVYNEKMERFYKESDALIFESMVTACRPEKQLIMRKVKERIENYLQDHHGEKLNILMLGEGVGSEILYLYQFYKNNANLFYFDVPGSKTFEFAMKRFKKYNVDVKLIFNYNEIPKNFFDVIVSMEVLEHLPNPIEAIKDISNFLRIGGIALITESFGAVQPNFPTHLRSNLKFEGKTPFLFLKYNLILSYFNQDPFLLFRPMEFTKTENISIIREYINLILTKPIIVSYLKGIIKRWLKREK